MLCCADPAAAVMCSVKCVCADDDVDGHDDDVVVDHGVFSKSHLQIIQQVNTLTGDKTVINSHSLIYIAPAMDPPAPCRTRHQTSGYLYQ